MYDKLVLSGGSMKGLSYIGLFKYLEENSILLHQLKEVVGTSIGSFSALLLVLGYTSDELKEIFFDFDFDTIKDYKISSFAASYGLDSGEKLDTMIKIFIKNKNFDENITMKELYEKTNKGYVSVATNVHTRETVFFNKDTFPDLKVYLAARMSMNIPLVFAPVEHNGHYYADGGLTCNFPTKYYKSGEGILCVSLTSHDPNKPDIIDDFEIYLYNVLKSAFYTIECNDIEYAKSKNYNVICIELRDVSGLDFKVPLEKRKELYDIGYNSAKKFFKKKIE